MTGSYWEDRATICGLCGTRIENPPPTSCYPVFYTLKDVLTRPRLFWKWWRWDVKEQRERIMKGGS